MPANWKRELYVPSAITIWHGRHANYTAYLVPHDNAVSLRTRCTGKCWLNRYCMVHSNVWLLYPQTFFYNGKDMFITLSATKCMTCMCIWLSAFDCAVYFFAGFTYIEKQVCFSVQLKRYTRNKKSSGWHIFFSPYILMVYEHVCIFLYVRKCSLLMWTNYITDVKWTEIMRVSV